MGVSWFNVDNINNSQLLQTSILGWEQWAINFSIIILSSRLMTHASILLAIANTTNLSRLSRQ